jgi:serine/threonine-protein kinase RsbW
VATLDAEHEIRLTIPAKAEYISLCRLALSGLARVRTLDDETLADLKLAITEACSNSVRHAYTDEPGMVEVTYGLGVDRLVIEVSDDGNGFAPYVPPQPDPDDLTEGGLGIAIIQAIADEFELGPGRNGGGSRLRFAKKLEA